MADRNDDLGELLTAAARMAELAARHELAVVTHLLDLLQLEVIKSLYGYSDGEGTLAAADAVRPDSRAPRKTRRLRIAKG